MLSLVSPLEIVSWRSLAEVHFPSRLIPGGGVWIIFRQIYNQTPLIGFSLISRPLVWLLRHAWRRTRTFLLQFLRPEVHTSTTLSLVCLAVSFALTPINSSVFIRGSRTIRQAVRKPWIWLVFYDNATKSFQWGSIFVAAREDAWRELSCQLHGLLSHSL